ncbi:MAG: hypothetical protein HY735_29085 [Verrucomicrobia bacterium]|nr:hypothetical protein [Verrucomicrobiota bacterium]
MKAKAGSFLQQSAQQIATLSLGLCWFTLLPQRVSAQTIRYAFTNFVGMPGGSGKADGIGPNARFYSINALATDRAGNLYALDGNRVRAVSAEGVVKTAGDFSSQKLNENRYISGTSLAIDREGNWYLADFGGSVILKLVPAGDWTVLAGQPGHPGFADGTGSEAGFSSPRCVAVDTSGNIYVAEPSRIRKVTASGVVATVAGSTNLGTVDGTGTQARFVGISGIALDPAGNLYVAQGYLRKVSPSGVVTTISGVTQARSVAVDGTGNILVGGDNDLLRITPTGDRTILLSWPNGPDWSGTPDPEGPVGSVNSIASDPAGNAYLGNVTEIWKVTPEGVVSSLAGSRSHWGSTDGKGSQARFYFVGFEFGLFGDMAVDNAGNLFVADTGNAIIRKVSPEGVVTTLAGSPCELGSADGPGHEARFHFPESIAVDSLGDVYVTDRFGHTLRKVTSTGLVTTLAGNPFNLDSFGRLVGGFSDGIGANALFNFPEGVAVDNTGNIFVVEAGFPEGIRKVSSSGVVTTLKLMDTEGVADDYRWDIAADNQGTLFVSYYTTIRKVAPSGKITTLTDGGARGLTVDSAGNVFVAGNHTIRRISSDGMVTTIGGAAGVIGGADGVGTNALFSYPTSVAVDSAGNLYVLDAGNFRISKGTPILTPEPRFSSLSISSGVLTAQLSGLLAGWAIIIESSNNLRDWSPFQTHVASGSTLVINHPIDPASGAKFLRAVAK